jgi:hypothetical protein
MAFQMEQKNEALVNFLPLTSDVHLEQLIPHPRRHPSSDSFTSGFSFPQSIVSSCSHL